MPLTVLQRTGDCNRCGACCVDDDRDTEKATGLTTTVPGYCVYFRWTSPGVGHCVGRDSAYYKQGCDVFPSVPQQVSDKPLCSYTWVRDVVAV